MGNELINDKGMNKAFREKDKSKITSVAMKFMKTAKYTWQDYKTNEDMLSELKINPIVKKIQNYRNKSTQQVQQIYKDYYT
jgi:hypothetical protein